MALIQGIVEAFRKYETLCTMVDGIRARRRWLVTVVKAGPLVKSSFSGGLFHDGSVAQVERWRMKFRGAGFTGRMKFRGAGFTGRMIFGGAGY